LIKRDKKIRYYFFDLLPIEVIIQITKYCTFSCITVLAVTKKKFYNIILPTNMEISTEVTKMTSAGVEKTIEYTPFFSSSCQELIIIDIFKNIY
jgi:hypothetical protein